MDEDKLWKTTTLRTWNVALNAKTKMNDFEQLNYGSKCLIVSNGFERQTKKWIWTPKWGVWLWTPTREMALNAYEGNDSECLWKLWIWMLKLKEVAIMPKLKEVALNA